MELKRLNEDDVFKYQNYGYFDEHLATFYSIAYGEPYVYRDTYLIYYDPLSKVICLTLFELNGNKDKMGCIKTSIHMFAPEKIVITSPEKMPPEIGDYTCENTTFDKDYQIYLPEFDENLCKNAYKDIRYRVNNAKKRGYTLVVGKEMTPAHWRIIASHLARKNCDLWDCQLYLSLNDYLRKYKLPTLFNAFANNVLIGFDVVDFLNSTTMAVPLGFYLEHPSLADFLTYQEIVYAKEQKFEWLDIGWACNLGLEEFKKKWHAIPRFQIWVQEYARKGFGKHFEGVYKI